MAEMERATLWERWQFRQEMRAHDAWNSWRLPTLQDFNVFMDLQRLRDTLETWRPNNLNAYGLGAEGEKPLTDADKDRTEGLLWHRVENGLTEAQLVDYAQLLNRWRLEHVPELKTVFAEQAQQERPTPEVPGLEPESHHAPEPMSAADVDNSNDKGEMPYIPTAAEQQAYEDAPYDRLEDAAHGTDERPYDDTSAALNEALWEVNERL